MSCTVPTMPLASMANSLGSLDICASIRKSSSLGPIMSHANKATDIHRTRVDNGTPLTRRSGTRISRGGIGGLGLRDWDRDANLRWAFFDPSCRKSKEPRPHPAKVSTPTPLPRGGASVVNQAVGSHRQPANAGS
ncbi:hypothetical protein FOYG_03461 [Fusarium oxysporum NRRL 32931]|uniref:Uncharacterized protein n=1 Tax=Fusarium oxysporum NRRL 32931 TaxID=660029 RepID=W9J3Q1_FUSOX|nr:hypothetical protein FOYG_03461 [Fusarium oxysporum NRRL 32931]KAJ0145035.1 Uncharacterized protein HZ326_12256 [Fusarium oxysporum f. sp. albedinis]